MKKKALSVIVIVIFLYELLHSYMEGFRWPSDYVMTNHVISYRQGFLPRSLIGGIGYVLFRDKWYSWKVLMPVIMFVSLLFCLWTIYLLVHSGYGFRQIYLFAITAAFAISPFAKYFLHLMGYYEMYGYVIVIGLIAVCKEYSVFKTYVLPGICSFIILLISESNIFLVVPVVFAISFLTLLDETDLKKTAKRLLVLFCSYVPHLIYCIIIWVYKVPEVKILLIQDYDRKMVTDYFPYQNFIFREDVHLYMSGDRSNSEIWKMTFHPMHPWCFAMIILLLLFVVYGMIENNLSGKMILAYLLSAGIAGFAAYSIVLVAWDLNRYFFNSFMSVLLVSIYFIKKSDIHMVQRNRAYVMILLFVVAFYGMSQNRFALFDNVTYNDSWQMCYQEIANRLAIW